TCASFGRCSLIRSPPIGVAVFLKGPPFLWPGLRSQVSVWLGPPAIQRTIHALVRFLSAAAASLGSHGHAAAAKALARLMRTKSRRVYSCDFMWPSRGQGSGIRGQESGVRGQASGVRLSLLTPDP